MTSRQLSKILSSSLRIHFSIFIFTISLLFICEEDEKPEFAILVWWYINCGFHFINAPQRLIFHLHHVLHQMDNSHMHSQYAICLVDVAQSMVFRLSHLCRMEFSHFYYHQKWPVVVICQNLTIAMTDVKSIKTIIIVP